MARARDRKPDSGPLPVLPAELRQRPAQPSRLPSWRRARRAWEAGAGMSVEALWQAELAIARAEGTLAAINACYEPGVCIEGEEDDPREVIR